jgi:hypothetical protein
LEKTYWLSELSIDKLKDGNGAEQNFEVIDKVRSLLLPDITQQSYAAKSQRTYFGQTVGRDTTQCYYFGIDNTRLSSFPQTVRGKGGGISLFGNTIVYGAKKNIIACTLIFRHFCQ